MFRQGNKKSKNGTKIKILDSYVRFRSSIYGRVVFIISIASIFLFISFWMIFRSVNERYMKSILEENGHNIGSLVEGALYESMLKNDRTSLQNTLDIINRMTGIDDVNMYDNEYNLAYSSISGDDGRHGDPDCKSCHADMISMFPKKEKAYKIIEEDSECKMSQNRLNGRHLLISSPILNAPSCYTGSCHAHNQNEEVLGSLLIKLPLKGIDDSLNRSRKNYFIVASVMTSLLLLILVVFTSEKIKKPLNSIIKASEAVSMGDNSTRLEVKPNQLSDMRMVSVAFNHMLDSLQKATTELQNWSQQLEYKVQKKSEELGHAQNELMNIERIASLGRLSLSVAHEINNPLSGILIYAKLIQKQLQNQDLAEEKKASLLKHLRLIESEAKRCGDIVKGLLDFSRKDQNDFEPRNINDVLIEAYDLMTHPMKVANISFLLSLSAKNDMVYCSPNQIKQICVALLVNAIEAIRENGEVILSTVNPDDLHIRIDVTDNGIGISDDDLPHIFEPFYTTKDKGNGIGLGLSIVHGIVQNHKGKTEVRSEKGKGTTISVILPIINS